MLYYSYEETWTQMYYVEIVSLEAQKRLCLFIWWAWEESFETRPLCYVFFRNERVRFSPFYSSLLYYILTVVLPFHQSLPTTSPLLQIHLSPDPPPTPHTSPPPRYPGISTKYSITNYNMTRHTPSQIHT